MINFNIKSKPITEFKGEYIFLSNFYNFPIRYDGVLYKTSEHAYQSQKTFVDKEINLIKEAPTPEAAKKIAQGATLREDWGNIKVQVMRDVLWAKFSNPFLSDKLVSTGNATLIEGNTWGDVFWGVCDGKGKNMLGRLLMEIRKETNKPHFIELP
jgi:ribA/ribD-fused uncharacterized protein